MRRRVSFADMSVSVPPEQGTVDRYPVSPHPVRLQPDEAAQIGQPGKSGSPRLLHTPKKSILRPRGSKAQVSELAPRADLPAPAAMSTARSGGFSEASQSTAASAESTEASFAGVSGDSLTSSRPWAQTYEVHESQVKIPPNRTAAPSGKGSNEYIRGTSVQDLPLTPKSPTALQAKLQRLKAKWSTLAGHPPSESDSNNALKPAGGAGHLPAENRTAVNVTASAPFTITQLDREESAGIDSLPSSNDTIIMSSQVASAREEADASSSYIMPQPLAESAHNSPRHDNADGEPARSAWEEALGLPAGVNLWGPTVVELPDSDSMAELSTGTDLASSPPQADILYVTAPRPIAEAVEAESFDGSSQLTSPTTATLSITEMRSPDSRTETESTLYVQGNGVYEDQASTVSSSTLTPSTLTLEAASATIAESPEPHSVTEASPEEPDGAPLTNLDAIEGTAPAAPTERHQRLTLDQVLSTERANPLEEASHNSHLYADQWQSSTSAAGMPARMQGGSAREPGLNPGVTQPAAATTAAGECKDASGNKYVPSSSIEQDVASRDPHARDHVGLAFPTPEPAALDRGEPTFEENMRFQETKGTGRRGVQLLPQRKQGPLGQQVHGSGSPQRSFSPFGRFGCLPRSNSWEDSMPMPSAKDIENFSDKPKQAAESVSGPGPLETGIHQVELGGYYLTTPDPLRTDPGFALRRRTSSEQSGQSVAQHAQHSRDPLNSDPVQYVSSPSWRMSALSALHQLKPSPAPAAASDSEAWQAVSRPGPSPASMKQILAQEAHSQHRQGYTRDRTEVEDAAWPDRRPKERDHIKSWGSGLHGKVPSGSARLQDSPGKEHNSRGHVKRKKSRGSIGKGHSHRHTAGHDAARPSMSEVSSLPASLIA